MDSSTRTTSVLVCLLCFVHLVPCALIEGSYREWHLEVSPTQHYSHHDNRDIRLVCQLTPQNKSIPLNWYEGLSLVENDGNDTQLPELVLASSLENYGKYTCKALISSNLTLQASTWLLPKDNTSQFVEIIKADHNKTYNTSCLQGVLWKKYLYNRTFAIEQVSNSIFSHTFKHISDQFKFVCLEDDSVTFVSYMLPNAQPIRFVSPSKRDIRIPEDLSTLRFFCKVEGNPRSIITFKRENPNSDDNAKKTSSDNCLEVLYKSFFRLFDRGWYVCNATNLWESVVYRIHLDVEAVTEKPPGPEKNTFYIEKFTITPPIAQKGRTVTLECLFNILEDTGDNIHIGLLDTYSPEPVTTEVFRGTGKGSISYDITVDANSTKSYKCHVFRFNNRFGDSEVTSNLTIADRDLLSVVYVNESVEIVSEVVNVTAIFSVYPGVDPTLLVHSKLFGEEGLLLDTYIAGWTQSKVGDELHVTVTINPYPQGNISSFLITGVLTSELAVKVSYYDYHAEASINVTFGPNKEVPLPKQPTEVVVAIASVMVVMTIAILIVMCTTIYAIKHWKRKLVYSEFGNVSPQQRARQKLLAQVSAEMKPLGLLYEDKQLELGESLGEGSFGVVYSGRLAVKGKALQVAAKTIKDSLKIESLEEFVKELRMLQRLGQHPNIINLVGACLLQDTLYILLEYASGGRLLSYLHKQRPKQQLSWNDRVSFSLQIAQGMEYLASRKCVHCDLAARNVLLMEDNTLKVCDFGLARKLYQEVYHKHITTDTRLPIKWMALESIERQEFSSQSDVWAFGVLVWEIATLGRTPYPFVSNQQILLKMLREGRRLDYPEQCPVPLWTIMRSCWLPNPDDRPTFIQLVAMLRDLNLDHDSFTSKEKEYYEQLAHQSLGGGYESSIEGDGYCSYCKAKLEEDDDSDGVSIDHSRPVNQPHPVDQPRPPAVLKPAAKRVDSGDSGICHNCRSECGSTFSMGQSTVTGGYTGGFSSIASSAYYTGGYLSGGSSVTYNLPHSHHPPNPHHLHHSHHPRNPHQTQHSYHTSDTPTVLTRPQNPWPHGTHPPNNKELPQTVQVYYRSHPQEVQVGVVESDV